MRNIRLFLVVVLFTGTVSSYAQFWQGFLNGIANAMQQQSYNYNRPKQPRSEPVEENIQNEEDGFVWIRLRQWDSQNKKFYYGAKDKNGNILIPISKKYTGVYYLDVKGHGGYFDIEINNGEGVCDRYGKILYYPTKDTQYICVDGKFRKKVSNGNWENTIAYLDSDGHGYKQSSTSANTTNSPSMRGISDNNDKYWYQKCGVFNMDANGKIIENSSKYIYPSNDCNFEIRFSYVGNDSFPVYIYLNEIKDEKVIKSELIGIIHTKSSVTLSSDKVSIFTPQNHVVVTSDGTILIYELSNGDYKKYGKARIFAPNALSSAIYGVRYGVLVKKLEK